MEALAPENMTPELSVFFPNQCLKYNTTNTTDVRKNMEHPNTFQNFHAQITQKISMATASLHFFTNNCEKAYVIRNIISDYI